MDVLGYGLQLKHNYLIGGLAGTTRAIGKRLGLSPEPGRVRDPAYPNLAIRYGTSDIAVYRQVITEEQCAVTLNREPRLIVDAGAHIGLVTTYYATRYPEATIVAIEPHPDNLEFLTRNTAGFANVRRLHGAVATRDEPMRIVNPRAQSWAFRVSPVSGNADTDALRVPGYTINTIMELAESDHIDVLKLDVEGTEAALFRDCSEWIDRVDVIVAELHDDLVEGCSRAFFEATTGFETDWRNGEMFGTARKGTAAAPIPGRDDRHQILSANFRSERRK